MLINLSEIIVCIYIIWGGACLISGRNQEKRTSIRDGQGGRFKQPDVTSGENGPVVF